MANAQVQVVASNTVVNVFEVNASATVDSGGGSVSWPGGSISAQSGQTFHMQEGAGIGWTLVGGALVAPPAPPAQAAPVPASVSRRQFFQAAAQESIITQVEAITIFATGAIPANLAAALATMPAADQFATQIAILGNATFERANPLVAELGAAMGQTPAQIDALFTLAASL